MDSLKIFTCLGLAIKAIDADDPSPHQVAKMVQKELETLRQQRAQARSRLEMFSVIHCNEMINRLSTVRNYSDWQAYVAGRK